MSITFRVLEPMRVTLGACGVWLCSKLDFCKLELDHDGVCNMLAPNLRDELIDEYETFLALLAHDDKRPEAISMRECAGAHLNAGSWARIDRNERRRLEKKFPGLRKLIAQALDN